jgi:hypothetical protein
LARVGINLSSKPFGFLCTALPKFCQPANYDAAASGHLTHCSSTLASTSRSQVFPPGSISIPQVSNPGFIPPGHQSTSALAVLEAASQSQEQHYPETPSPSSSIAASDTSDTLPCSPHYCVIHQSWGMAHQELGRTPPDMQPCSCCYPCTCNRHCPGRDCLQYSCPLASASSSCAGHPAPTCLAHCSHLPSHAVRQPQTVTHAGHWLQHTT